MDPDVLTSLRIAVSGHRDLDPAAEHEVRRAVRDVLGPMIDRCGAAPVELMTGMADGADRWVTDVADDLGCRIHVVLPKPVDTYRGELSEAGADRLDTLGSRSDVEVTTITDFRADDDPSAPYSCLGEYLARSAHVLIAVWDGSDERKPGGTLDVLSLFLDRADTAGSDNQPPTSIEATDELGDLPGPTAVWVRADRLGRADRGALTTKYLISSGLPGIWRTTEQLPIGLTSMLDDLAAVAEIASEAAGEEAGYPLLDEIPADIDPSRRRALEEIHEAHLVADRLAVLHQSRSNLSFIGASLIAAAMGFAFLWFAKIDDHVAWLYGYLALFVGGYVLYRVARGRHWLGLHLSLRVLAETLRVRFFLTILGIADRVDVRRVFAFTGVVSFPGFGWAVEADRMGVPTTRHLSSEVGAMSDLARVEWVHDQARYFQNRISELHVRHKRLELVQGVLYVLSFIAVIVIIVWGKDLKDVYGPGHVSFKTILVFLMGLLPLWLTLWELHQSRMATRELLWQFRNQAAIFRQASVHLSDLEHEDAMEQIFVELAERSLFETYLWAIHRFHREFTPPSGG
jgi:hypothetical protein